MCVGYTCVPGASFLTNRDISENKCHNVPRPDPWIPLLWPVDIACPGQRPPSHLYLVPIWGNLSSHSLRCHILPDLLAYLSLLSSLTWALVCLDTNSAQ